MVIRRIAVPWKVSQYYQTIDSSSIHCFDSLEMSIFVHNDGLIDCAYSYLTGLAQDADVVVHEATNTFLPGVDKDGNMRLVTKDAKIHGHSTPAMVSTRILLSRL